MESAEKSMVSGHEKRIGFERDQCTSINSPIKSRLWACCKKRGCLLINKHP
jgi:hypothetical protein